MDEVFDWKQLAGTVKLSLEDFNRTPSEALWLYAMRMRGIGAYGAEQLELDLGGEDED